MSRIPQIIDSLEAEKADLQRRLEWIDGQLQSFREHVDSELGAPGPAPKRSTTRRTTRSASPQRTRRASGKRDVASAITGYLAQNPNSTAADVAKGLGLKRSSVATKLSQMAKAGTISKADRGYRSKA